MVGIPPRGVKPWLGYDSRMSSLFCRVFVAFATLAIALAGTSASATGPVRVDALEVELVSSRDGARPGEPLDLGLRIRHDPGWHTYWRNPGDSGLPTQVRLSGPEGAQIGEIRWPAPSRMFVGPLANYGFEGEIVLPIQVVVPKAAAGPVRFDAQAEWLVCREVCIPGEAKVSLTLPVARGPTAPSAHAPLFEAMARRMPAMTLDAALHRDGRSLALVFGSAELDAVTAAEFFPYPVGVVSAPAPQSLSRTASGWRLDVALAEGAAPPALLSGVLLANGRPLEVRATAVAGPAPAGTLVSVAQAPAEPPRAGGLLANLFGQGSGSISAPALASGAAGTATAASPAVTAGLLAMLGFGLLGGLILNLMPCVFPVVGLKVLGFANAGAIDRAAASAGTGWAGRRSAIAFSLGVLVSFWVLAAIVVGLRVAGESVGWGFQLQSPLFVGAMALLFVAIGLNFSGVYDIGLGLSRLGGIGGSTPGGSFATGVLAVLVATPCTAPFMGTALGYTLARPASETWLIFTSIGLGMALPYLLLGWFPRWLGWLPRPGRWMETLRQALAFPMYATAAWLAWVLAQQAGPDGVLRLLIGAVLVGLLAWLYGRYASAPRSRARHASALAGVVALVALAGLLAPLADDEVLAEGRNGFVAQAQADAQGWQPWSEAAVAATLAEGRPVFIDFTAAWCVSCQANKKLVLERRPVAETFARKGVVAMRADWTQRDPAITAALARYGRNGVPLYVVYRPGEAQPRLLPELLTTGIVLDALR